MSWSTVRTARSAARRAARSTVPSGRQIERVARRRPSGARCRAGAGRSRAPPGVARAISAGWSSVRTSTPPVEHGDAVGSGRRRAAGAGRPARVVVRRRSWPGRSSSAVATGRVAAPVAGRAMRRDDALERRRGRAVELTSTGGGGRSASRATTGARAVVERRRGRRCRTPSGRRPSALRRPTARSTSTATSRRSSPSIHATVEPSGVTREAVRAVGAVGVARPRGRGRPPVEQPAAALGGRAGDASMNERPRLASADRSPTIEPVRREVQPARAGLPAADVRRRRRCARRVVEVDDVERPRRPASGCSIGRSRLNSSSRRPSTTATSWSDDRPPSQSTVGEQRRSATRRRPARAARCRRRPHAGRAVAAPRWTIDPAVAGVEGDRHRLGRQRADACRRRGARRRRRGPAVSAVTATAPPAAAPATRRGGGSTAGRRGRRRRRRRRRCGRRVGGRRGDACRRCRPTSTNGGDERGGGEQRRRRRRSTSPAAVAGRRRSSGTVGGSSSGGAGASATARATSSRMRVSRSGGQASRILRRWSRARASCLRTVPSATPSRSAICGRATVLPVGQERRRPAAAR